MPLAIDLFCGLGGWTEGLMAEGYRVVGFDMERHRYPRVIRPDTDVEQKSPSGGSRRNADGQSVFKDRPRHFRDTMKQAAVVEGAWDEYPAQLVLQDVLTIHGRQFKDAALIVASPPCQAYSYRAMPWKRAKALPPPDNSLFEACFRIQREACEAAGRHIPMVVENVRGAQKWVGRARWHYGSFYLWGDVPALMPIVTRIKKGRSNFHFYAQTGLPSPSFHGAAHEPSVMRHEAIKVGGIDFSGYGTPGYKAQAFNGTAEKRLRDDMKNGGDWFGSGESCSLQRRQSLKGTARKAASAHIAKIPLQLSRHIGKAWKPVEATA